MHLKPPPRARSLVLSVLAALTLAPACASDSTNPPPIDHGPGTGDTSTPATSGVDTGTGTGDGTADGTGTGEPPLNCQDITCSGHGGCEIGEDGNAYCACDRGYVINEAGDACVVDETCIKVRFLEDHCRQALNGPPAVSLFFALDFCSGTAVTSSKFQELGLDFQVLESGVDITKNVESESTILPTTVESYVTIVVDVSDSVTQSKDLPALVAELRALATSLQPTAGEPDVYLSVYVFGRFVAEYVPFTRDFAAVDAALAQIESDPASVVSLVNGDGTALYAAVAKGIDRTQRIRDMRDAVSWGGVLSTGTVVVVTDGQDTSAGMLDKQQIDRTVNQVISIGISEDIDDADLEAIGRDGSFLAPTPADWTEAFAEVAQRVDEYPDRAYLLAYCSSATVGQPEVEVNVIASTKLMVEQTAVCQFDADVFSSDPGQICSAEYFTSECDTQACGGLTGCGACADDQCCNGGACISPVSADVSPSVGCAGLDDLCSATGEVCTGSVCEPPSAVGEACGAGCMPGEGWCDMDVGDPPGICAAASPIGTTCELATHCESLNCQPTNPDNPFQVPTCQPPALAHDRCEGGGAVRCEEGSYCQGSVCEPKKIDAETCSGAEHCRSGLCDSPVETQVCVGTGLCYWAWDEKVPS